MYRYTLDNKNLEIQKLKKEWLIFKGLCRLERIRIF